MVLRLAYYGDPILRKETSSVQEVNDELRTFIQQMFEAMTHYDGAGLAAPQVHRSISLFVMCMHVETEDGQWLPGKPYVFINPEILEQSEEQWVCKEGCISIPELRSEVPRPEKIKVKALDFTGREFVQEFSGMEARCILHETDHLHGVLYIDRIHKKERERIKPILKRIKKKYYGA